MKKRSLYSAANYKFTPFQDRNRTTEVRRTAKRDLAGPGIRTSAR